MRKLSDLACGSEHNFEVFIPFVFGVGAYVLGDRVRVASGGLTIIAIFKKSAGSRRPRRSINESFHIFQIYEWL